MLVMGLMAQQPDRFDAAFPGWKIVHVATNKGGKSRKGPGRTEVLVICTAFISHKHVEHVKASTVFTYLVLAPTHGLSGIIRDVQQRLLGLGVSNVPKKELNHSAKEPVQHQPHALQQKIHPG